MSVKPSSPDGIRVTAADGCLCIKASALFVANDDSTIHTLMERLFQESAVEAIAVDREQTAINISYDQSLLDAQTALRTLSNRLLSSDRPQDESLMHQYLSRVPGRVKRVERRLPDETAPRSGRHLHPAESLLIVENLIVEYEPVPGTTSPPIDEAPPEREHHAAGALPADVTRPWVGEVMIGGVRRIINLTAAGGCLVMSIVGVITPGIPTVPFVLATGYFLARSSPKLHARFRRAPLFGPMLTDYEDHGGLRWTTKLKAIGFTGGLMAITVVLAGPSLPLLLVVTVMGSIGIYMVARLPTIGSPSQLPALAPA